MSEKSQQIFLTWAAVETPKFLVLLLKHKGVPRILIEKLNFSFVALLDSKAIKFLLSELSCFKSRFNTVHKIIQFLKCSNTVIICKVDTCFGVSSTEAEHLFHFMFS